MGDRSSIWNRLRGLFNKSKPAPSTSHPAPAVPEDLLRPKEVGAIPVVEEQAHASVASNPTLEPLAIARPKPQVVVSTTPAIDLVLGIDFGTSCSKVVIGDRVWKDRSYAIPFGSVQNGISTWLHPTRLGSEANLKMRFMKEPGSETVHDLVACYLAEVIRHSRSWFESNSPADYRNRNIKWSINLGFPDKKVSRGPLADAYRSAARVAVSLASDPGEPSLEKAREIRLRPAEFDAFVPATRIELYPEIAAQLAGYVNSPFRKPGNLVLVDVGAGTLDVSTIILHTHTDLRVTRDQHPALFEQMSSLLKGVMTEIAAYNVERRDEKSEKVVELVSPIALYDIKSQLSEVVKAFVDQYSDLKYPWKLMGQHLSVCNLYCSCDTIEVRPLLPPTLTHQPFAGARQRIYMSATLGEDGDLERTFGVKKIARVPVPEGWDKRGTGRRLVLFPELSPQIGPDLLERLFTEAKRTLILVPNIRLRDSFTAELKAKFHVFSGPEVEQHVETFRSHAGPVVLILANRYDGIDFPGDDCRSLLICDLPTGASLQETFFTQRLKAFLITRDRIRTRVTQALGRCTRDESDYSVVLIVGDELVKWFCTSENVRGMHPELQAEIAFGLANSTEGTTETFQSMAKALLTRSEQWDGAEDFIKLERSKRIKKVDDGAPALQKAAALEIDFNYFQWNGQFEKSYQTADSILSCLSGGEVMRAYQCLWQHQAAVAAYLNWKQTGNDSFRHIAVERLNNAAKGNFGIHWLASLAGKLGEAAPTTKEAVPEDWISCLENLLGELKLAGSKFNRAVAEQRSFICSTDAKRFHQGLNFLGRMLGASTHEWDGDAKPDGFWRFGILKGFVFEAKTQEFCDGAISVKTVRQALTHEKCVRDDSLLPPFALCTTVVISPRSTIEPEAHKHADKLYYCAHSAFMDLFEKAAAALTELRTVAPSVSQDLFSAEATKIYSKHGCLPKTIEDLLAVQKLTELPTAVQTSAIKRT